MSPRRGPVLTGSTPQGEPVILRPLRRGDRRAFLDLRAGNDVWLQRWDPTAPPGAPRRPDLTHHFAGYVRSLGRQQRAGTGLSLVIVVDDAIVGMIAASSIVEGAFRSCSIGYWVGEEVAGRWIAPTAVAMLADHLMDPRGRGLHRVQIDIVPDNAPSLAVVRKLGLREEGTKRAYLHIGGRWRDHRSFAVVAEEVGAGGLLARLSHEHQQSRARHTE